MGSIMKMFKPSKKSSNKENQPAVSFASNSLKSKKSTFSESVYAGEPHKIDLRLKSPYAVITGPKTTRGPMSCPGGPIDENLFRNARNSTRVKDDSFLNKRSELVDDQTYRNLVARQKYDQSMSQFDSDDEEDKYKGKYRAAKAEIMVLKAKIEKMKTKWREEKTMMTDTIDDLSNENYHFKKSHDRMRHKYTELKSNLEMEKRMKCDVLKMLQEANARIEKLEKCRGGGGILDESLNNSSLLMPSYTDSALERSSEGAGEALCFPETQQFGIFSEKLNPLPKSLQDDLEAQDEVRIFRNSVESIEEDEEMTEDEELEISSPFEVESARQETKKAADLVETISLAGQEPPVGIPEKKYSRTNSWLKRNSVNPDDDGSSDSSEEERLSLIERQLKKKGGLVKYNPPRTKIHDKHYKRFGKNERSALAEFEYLQDMSTDVSGMQSSPELGQLMGQMLKK